MTDNSSNTKKIYIKINIFQCSDTNWSILNRGNTPRTTTAIVTAIKALNKNHTLYIN